MAKKQKKKPYNFKLRIILFTIVCVLVGVSFIFQAPIEKWINYAYNPTMSNDVTNSELKLHFIDVGQGDAIAIELPDGKHMLIDAGTSSSKTALTDYLNNTFFDAIEAKAFDYFIITHPHEDHIGGAVKIFSDYEIKNVYRPKVYSNSEIKVNTWNTQNSNIWDNTVKAINDESGCTVVFNDETVEISGVGYAFDFLSPLADSYDNVNNYSPIIMLTYDGRKIMLTGDAETEVENSVLADNAANLLELNVDVLKLGHHGSSTSTSQNFLETVDPEFVVISVGANNSYHHPSTSTMNRISDYGLGETQILRTDIQGNIVIGVKNNEEGLGIISASVNYTYQTSFYISYYYISGIVLFISLIVIFAPKGLRKDIKKALSSKK